MPIMELEHPLPMLLLLLLELCLRRVNQAHLPVLLLPTHHQELDMVTMIMPILRVIVVADRILTRRLLDEVQTHMDQVDLLAMEEAATTPHRTVMAHAMVGVMLDVKADEILPVAVMAMIEARDPLMEVIDHRMEAKGRPTEMTDHLTEGTAKVLRRLMEDSRRVMIFFVLVIDFGEDSVSATGFFIHLSTLLDIRSR